MTNLSWNLSVGNSTKLRLSRRIQPERQMTYCVVYPSLKQEQILPIDLIINQKRRAAKEGIGEDDQTE
jgi:hypothetical protein